MNSRTRLSLTSAHARSSRVAQKMDSAMSQMEAEIDAGDGVYAGRLSLNEICRRAGVHPVTVHGPSHAKTTKPRALAWLSRMKKKTGACKHGVRSNDSRRALDAREELKALAANFRLRENEVARLNEEIDRLRRRVAELEAETQELQKVISKGRVVSLPKKCR